MRMFQSRLGLLRALATSGGELVANGKGYLPTADQMAFFGINKAASALASQLAAMEADQLIVRELLPGGRRTRAIRLTPIGWEALRDRGVLTEPSRPEPEPVKVIEQPDGPESDLVTMARELLALALTREADLLGVEALQERYAEMASALEKTLGDKRRVEILLRDANQALRIREREIRLLRIQLGRVEQLLAEARRVPRDSELYRSKLEELARLMEEKPKVSASA